MNKEDIIRMAREAGIEAEKDTLCRNEGWVKPLECFAAIVLANNPPQSFMSWQEGYNAGRNAATLEFLKQLRQLHDSYSLQSNPNTVQAKGTQR